MYLIKIKQQDTINKMVTTIINIIKLVMPSYNVHYTCVLTLLIILSYQLKLCAVCAPVNLIYVLPLK